MYGKDPFSMKKNDGHISETVAALVGPSVSGLGYDLWDVEYEKDGPDWFLRVIIDSSDGIKLEDCERVHRTIEPIIDEADPIQDSYYLEVSSPGVERELKKEKHIKASIGQEVDVKLFSALDGKKHYRGILKDYSGENIVIATGEGEKSIPCKQISKIMTVFDFSQM